MTTTPVPVVGWLATDDEWRAARRKGCSASDVAALLGFDRYTTPWALWADKTGHPMAPVDEGNEAARLGNELEPWLLERTSRLFERGWAVGQRFPARLYAHSEQPWRLCTPDGFVLTLDRLPVSEARPGHIAPIPPPDWRGADLVETKTAGLQTGRAHGWTDTTIPLGYELQARWQMHVMNAPVCHVVALVAGRGLCHYPITRDLDIEAELVRQVDAWWTCHVVGGVEPPLSGRDSAIIAALYPRVERRTVNLDGTDALTYWQAYRDAHTDVTEAEARKAEAGTALKALLGDAHTGLVDGRPIATWGERRGRIDWETLARALYRDVLGETEGTSVTIPPFEELAEQHRGPTTRSLTVKE